MPVTRSTAIKIIGAFLFVLVIGVVLFKRHAEISAALMVSSSQATLSEESLSVSPDGSQIDVALRIQAHDKPLRSVSIWWFISPPTSDQPWKTPMYQSETRSIPYIGANDFAEVHWSEKPGFIPTGVYVLSAWAHEDVDGSSQHLVGGKLHQIQITEARAMNVHQATANMPSPIGPIVIQSLTISQTRPLSRHLDVSATLANMATTPDPVTARIYWVISDLDNTSPWTNTLWRTPWTTVDNIVPGQSQEVRLSTDVDIPPGVYGISAWVHAQTGGVWTTSHASAIVPIQIADTTPTQDIGVFLPFHHLWASGASVCTNVGLCP